MTTPAWRRTATVLDVAKDLLVRETAAAGCVLDRIHWRIASFVAHSVPWTTHEVEMALGYLGEKGLVEEREIEGRVSAARPQAYRWARHATPTAFARIIDARPRCLARGCRNRIESDNPLTRYCSKQCLTKSRDPKEVT